MRIQIVTAGTYGSVAPYTGLGHRLMAEGHQVEIVTHAKFADSVACCGLGMRPLVADPFEGLLAVQAGSRSRSAPRAAYESGRASREAATALVDAILEAVDEKADLILLSTLAAPIGTVVAEYHRVPSAGVFLQPEEPTAAFPPCVLRRRGESPVNRWLGRAVNAGFDLLYAEANRRLHARLGLPRRGTAQLRRRRCGTLWPVWHGISPTVVPRPVDWRPGLHMSGYWWPHTCERWSPPAELADFLDAGPAPVLIGFGSMMPRPAEELGDIALRALRRAGLRGVVQSGWAGLSVATDDVITVGAVPHDWLMPRTAAVVHHAGAGTTAAGLRAGVPAVPVPVLTDQPWWSSRLVGLGVAPGVLPHAGLDSDRLAAALTEATTNPSYRSRAAALAAAIAREDGSGEVVRGLAGWSR
ncbi:glycosyltransferase [Streptomyces pathocidini]|uniref:Glycosyltransferase n=1 Tax=Streptomyces pathocidini TaxID=1650571 RepID=A0ABW7UU49_9ACTN|nr:glycosyltransferase [Streptomyces pathocidini]